METEIKAVVFKTPRLHETKTFCSKKLGLKIVESSNHHFVVHASGIRIVFVSAKSDVQVEIYLSHTKNDKRDRVDAQLDCNGIRYVICP